MQELDHLNVLSFVYEQFLLGYRDASQKVQDFIGFLFFKFIYSYLALPYSFAKVLQRGATIF